MSLWYEQAFRHVLYPAYETGLRRRGTLAWLAAYEQDQWLAPERIAALQFERLKCLLEHCYRDVPYYRSRWRALGVSPNDIHNLDDYAQLPPLTKADMREHADELIADSWRGRLLFKTTGGSTGEPMRFGYTRESNDRRAAVMWRGYGWAGSRMGKRTLYLWGGPVDPPSRSAQLKDRLYNAAFARRMLNSFYMTEANMATYADAIDHYRPDIIVGYVGPLVRLAQWLLATGRTPYRAQAVIGGAEALHEFQRQIIEQAFGCPAFNTYGCREFMLIASECEQRDGLHVNADHLVLELLDSKGARAASQSGEVAITDLFNYGMPFIRYINGDLATTTTTTASCACGRGLPRLAHVDGRTLDAIHTTDGRHLPGEFFVYLLKDVPGVEYFQLIQRQLERLDLSIVRGPNFNEDSLAMIRQGVRKVLGDKVELACHFVDEIPLTRSGKTRVTISELSS
jgi:phenylacetate-CoA ligase